ncbi:MAG: ABC transporter ATP-binding protein [Clostridia bacterium]|nr:ABC transporter ATP-binding protein [Clostridia bacterium]
MIKLKDIRKEYVLSKDNIVTALNDINLEIEEGEFVAIVGKSGSGKSTLLNIISCLDKEIKGSYILDDYKIQRKKPKELAKIRNQYFGFIFQNFNLLQKLTAYENIEIPLIYKRVPRKKRKELIEKYAEKVGILERLKHKPNELSGGQQQRVAIARALVTDPKIIMADEPTGALDEATGIQIMQILKELNNEGKTVLLVTHDMDLANQAKRKIVISDGKIISDSKGGIR